MVRPACTTERNGRGGPRRGPAPHPSVPRRRGPSAAPGRDQLRHDLLARCPRRRCFPTRSVEPTRISSCRHAHRLGARCQRAWPHRRDRAPRFPDPLVLLPESALTGHLAQGMQALCDLSGRNPRSPGACRDSTIRGSPRASMDLVRVVGFGAGIDPTPRPRAHPSQGRHVQPHDHPRR